MVARLGHYKKLSASDKADFHNPKLYLIHVDLLIPSGRLGNVARF